MGNQNKQILPIAFVQHIHSIILIIVSWIGNCPQCCLSGHKVEKIGFWRTHTTMEMMKNEKDNNSNSTTDSTDES